MALPTGSWLEGPLLHSQFTPSHLNCHSYGSHSFPDVKIRNLDINFEVGVNDRKPQHTRPYAAEEILPSPTLPTRTTYDQPPFRPEYYGKDILELANVIENSVSGVLDSSQFTSLQLLPSSDPQFTERSLDSVSTSASSTDANSSMQLTPLQPAQYDSDATLDDSPSPREIPDSTSDQDMLDGTPKGRPEGKGKTRRSGHQLLSEKRSHVLPPCKVCGTQATGFHYGVNTCEACKVSINPIFTFFFFLNKVSLFTVIL